jgi:hypothetical protein
MKTLYYYDEKHVEYVEYPWWKIVFCLCIAFLIGLYLGVGYVITKRVYDKPTVQYRNIMYQDSTTMVYELINPDSIKGDSKVAKDLRWYYRKNQKK